MPLIFKIYFNYKKRAFNAFGPVLFLVKKIHLLNNLSGLLIKSGIIKSPTLVNSYFNLLICISNSGETDELVRLLNYAKRNDIKSIAITGNVNSTISKEASISLNSSVESEACPLNLAPTCSTSVTMALGDALASICAMERGFKEIDFARFHPSGSLHKLNFEIVDNIMNSESLPICAKNTSLKDVIIEISKGQQGAVFVCENKKLLWVFTDGDLRRCIES